LRDDKILSRPAGDPSIWMIQSQPPPGPAAKHVRFGQPRLHPVFAIRLKELAAL
jgi:hypothetical protein